VLSSVVVKNVKPVSPMRDAPLANRPAPDNAVSIFHAARHGHGAIEHCSANRQGRHRPSGMVGHSDARRRRRWAGRVVRVRAATARSECRISPPMPSRLTRFVSSEATAGLGGCGLATLRV
jgi:hypothetical protein